MFALNPNDWRISSSKPAKNINFEKLGLNKIKYLLLLDEVTACEEQLNIRINVFTFDNTAGFKRHSQYISKKFKPQNVNFLYWEGRYALIKYFTRLFLDVRKYKFIILLVPLTHI